MPSTGRYDPAWAKGLIAKYDRRESSWHRLFMGIDPSLSSTGLAYILYDDYDQKVLGAATTTIECRPKDWTDVERIARIHDAILAAQSSVDGVAIEDMPRNAMSAGLTAQAHGVAKHALGCGAAYADNNAHLLAFAPATLKKIWTGSGKATKADMMQKSVNFAGEFCQVQDDNQADALALAYASLQHWRGQLDDYKYRDLGELGFDKDLLVSRPERKSA